MNKAKRVAWKKQRAAQRKMKAKRLVAARKK